MDWMTLAKNIKQSLIEDLSGVIAIPSLLDETTAKDQAPFGQEIRKALDYMLELAKRDGFKTTDVDGYAGIIEFGEGEEIVGVLGHLDVVPPGEGWQHQPFVASEDRGYLFGRGTMDDKGPTMAAYYAMKLLKDSGIKLNKRVFLILGCDEETGMRCMEYYKKHAPIPDLGFVPDADFPVIYGEKGILNVALKSSLPTVIQQFHAGQRPNIVIGQALATVIGEAQPELFNFYLKAHHLKGTITVTAEGVQYFIEGESAHGAFPENGNNAGVHLFRFIAGAYQDQYALTMAHILNDYYGKDLGIMYQGSHMGYLTMNVGIIDVTAEQQTINLDIRYPNDFDYQEILKRMESTLNQYQSGITIEILAHKEPLFVDPNSTLVQTLVACYRKYAKDDVTPIKTIGGGTYARCFDNFVAFGPEFAHIEKPDFVGDIHQADEAASIDQLILSCAIYAAALYELTR